MKKKFSFGEGGIKGLFATHIEKMAFVGVLALAAFLISSGMKGRSKVDSRKSPEDLGNQVSSAQEHIQRFRWETDYKKDRDLQAEFLPRAKETLEDIDVALYQPKQMIKPPYVPPRVRRTDPELYPAEELYVKSGYGAMPLPMDPNTRRPPRPRKQLDLQLLPEKEQENYRQLPQNYTSGGGSGRGGFGGGSGLQGVYFVSITGLIPFRKQVEEFNRCFLDSEDYRSTRDVPEYFYWFLERADVTSDPKMPDDQLKWKQVAYLKQAMEIEQTWSGGGGSFGGEFGDNKLYDLPKVTMGVPPIVGVDLEPWARHPKIPRVSPMEMEMGIEGKTPEGAEEEENSLFNENLMQPGGGGGMGMGMGMGRGMGMGMEGEMGGMMSRDMGDGDFGGEGMGGGGMNMMGGGFDPTDPSTLPEHKMFRFFEVSDPRNRNSIRPGRAYRYRLRLWLIDPNDPMNPAEAPRESMLDRTVIDRIQNKPPSPSKSIPRVFWRETDWSEPSPVVHVSTGRELLCGPVTPASLTKLSDGREFAKPGSEPVAKVMALEFDPVRAANMPGEFQANRGTIGYFQGDIWEPLPEDALIHLVEDYQFKINTTVLDLRGGKDLLETEGLLTTPSKMLVMDTVGRLSVRTESDDMVEYQRHMLVPEEDDEERGGVPGRGMEGGGDFGGFEGEMGF